MEKITVISHWYNEELLAPLFCNHYKDVDEVRILLETDTNDKTREICKGYANVIIQDVHCPSGMDNLERINNINQAISEVKDGWVYMVDADEFIFPEHHEDARIFLERQTADVVNCMYFHVYRHITESDIDYSLPTIPQRIHALEGGREHKNWFIKPSISRASTHVLRTIGGHGFVREHSVSNERYIGAHWKQADYKVCIQRRLSNMARHSQHDHQRRWGYHDFHVSEEKLRKQLEENSNLPVLRHFVGKE